MLYASTIFRRLCFFRGSVVFLPGEEDGMNLGTGARRFLVRSPVRLTSPVYLYETPVLWQFRGSLHLRPDKVEQLFQHASLDGLLSSLIYATYEAPVLESIQSLSAEIVWLRVRGKAPSAHSWLIWQISSWSTPPSPPRPTHFYCSWTKSTVNKPPWLLQKISLPWSCATNASY